VNVVEMRSYTQFNKGYHYILTVIAEQICVGRTACNLSLSRNDVETDVEKFVCRD